MLLLRLSQGVSSGCHHATPTHNFLELSLWEGRLILLLRLSQGISSGCHHATPTPQFFSSRIVINVGRGHYASAST